MNTRPDDILIASRATERAWHSTPRRIAGSALAAGALLLFCTGAGTAMVGTAPTVRGWAVITNQAPDAGIPGAADPPEASDRIYFHGGQGVSDEQNMLTGTIIDMDDGGIRFRPLQSNETFFTWDRIRTIQTAQSRYNTIFAAHADFADELWRARSRMERGDAALAEPLFSDLYQQTHTRSDESAIIVAEGVLRCRLARGAYADAVIPWLDVRRMIENRVSRSAFKSLPQVIDPVSGLCPALLPVWTDNPHTEALAASLAEADYSYTPITQQLAHLYEYSALMGLKRRPDPVFVSRWLAMDEDNDPGVGLVLCILRGADGANPQGLDFDKTLSRWLKDEDSPMYVWALMAQGQEQIKSADSAVVRRGMLDLLTIPGVFGDQAPHAAGWALYDAANAFESQGRDEAAQSLRDELHTRFRYHALNDPHANPSAKADRHETPDARRAQAASTSTGNGS